VKREKNSDENFFITENSFLLQPMYMKEHVDIVFNVCAHHQFIISPLSLPRVLNGFEIIISTQKSEL
jgi:hypothetical protein